MMSDEIVEQIVNEIPNLPEAIRTSVRRSGLSDKQIYLELGIDAGQWSRIMTGQANFPLEKLKEFLRIVGNDIFLRWVAKDCGYDLKLSQESYEERIEKINEEKRQLQIKLDNCLEMIELKSEKPHVAV